MTYLYRTNGNPPTEDYTALRDVCEDKVRSGECQVKIIQRAKKSDLLFWEPYSVTEKSGKGDRIKTRFLKKTRPLGEALDDFSVPIDNSSICRNGEERDQGIAP